MDLGDIIKSIETKGNLDLSVFREPRGVCRCLQLLIGTLTGLAIYAFEGVETIKYCSPNTVLTKLIYSYPFQLTTVRENLNCSGKTASVQLALDDSYSPYAEYFLIVSILSILYCFVAVVIYSKCTQTYETNDKYPLADFIGTVFIAVLWLFASAAWAHGLSALKSNTNPTILKGLLTSRYPDMNIEQVTNTGYFGLNVSAILGCLSFFLWASDLWFLYKDTPWFQGRRGQAVDSPA